ncbi:PulJ/GspJ family protein [Bythopirellula polymerisocia]|nr:hypothetical protein [Bythopirellula polymerisocia]
MQRHAFSLLELMIALGTSSLLVAGLASSLYISSQALSDNPNSSEQSRTSAIVLHDLAADLNKAISFSERTATALTFTVPDRNGDGTSETIRYAWSGSPGDPLTYQYNGGAIVNVATDVQSFNTTALTREMMADSVVASVGGEVVFEEFSSAKLASNGTSIVIAKPPGTSEGDLLIAAVSTDGNATTSLAGPAGWSLITIGPTSGSIRQTFGVWWKIASSSEPSSYQFSWAPSEQAFGWIMRFTGHDLITPINAFATESGYAILTASSPAVISSVGNAMILRLAGFDNRLVSTDLPGLLGHTPINMDSSSTSSSAASGGAGYLIQTAAGDSGSSSFNLTGAEEFTSVTIAIAPEVNP